MANETTFHPREVAKILGVHLRTVFRLVERGHLSLDRGRIVVNGNRGDTDTWNNSISQAQARKVFNVRQNTITSWINKGFLESVEVFGHTRVRNSSVERIKETRNGRKFFAPYGFVCKSTVLKISGLEHSKLKRFIEDGTVLSQIINGNTVIPVAEYERIKALMDSTIRPAEAQKILGKKRWEVRELRRSGILIEVRVFGCTRLSKGSLYRLQFDHAKSGLDTLSGVFQTQLSRIEALLKVK